MLNDPRPIRIERAQYPDGSPKAETHYRGESCHGPWRQWHPNGVLARDWCYDAHLLADGVHRTWHDNGRLESQLTCRSGRTVEELHFNKAGMRVPSPLEKKAQKEWAFLQEAALKSRLAKPIKRPRRIPSREAEKESAHIEKLLATHSAPALSWLRESTEQAPRALGELDHTTSLLLVEALHELGASEIRAVELEPGGADLSETTNHLIVTLPPDPVARARVLGFDRRLAHRRGFTTLGDWGQSHLYMKLC